MDSDASSYQTGLNLEMNPLNRGEKATWRRSRFQQQQAEAAVQNLQQQIEGEVRSAVVNAEKQWATIAAQQSVVENRLEELRVEQSRFRVGMSTNLNVLQVLNRLIEAQLNEISARINYIKALNTLYYSEGTLLERRSIGTQIQ